MKKNLCRWITAIFILTIFNSSLQAQIEKFAENDTLKVDSSHQTLKMLIEENDTTVLIPVDSLTFLSINRNIKTDRDPKRAWWYSAIIPGLGQAYNRKYWKIPIIYSVFLGTYFMIDDNAYKYRIHRDAYLKFGENGAPPWNPNFNEDLLKERKDFYRRNRDLGIIVGVIMYFMNILDASVDANLMNFDISDDLSMNVSPEIKPLNYTLNNSFGLKFVISLNK